ncbi:MAG: SDR family oxidoreductase [Myxococcota bacterium]|nr:SDR family oxidoreductase [Myxococcales bacterium]
MGRLRDRVAIITGAGMGIGRGLARRFAREGAKIVVAEYAEAAGRRTVEEVEALGSEALFTHTDVGEMAQIDAMIEAAAERFGRIDVLVNNAWSGGPPQRVEWFERPELDRAWRIGFLGCHRAMKQAFPYMKAQGAGSIINLCSLNGVNAHMFTMHYNTAKEALRALTRTAAVEWGPYNVRCNVICPAAATESYKAFASANPETAAEMLKENPLGRMGDPEEDIGGAALFLASDDARYVTGNTLFVDGGGHINGVSWRPALPEEKPPR